MLNSDKNCVDQSHLDVEGDVAGRDVNKTTYNINTPSLFHEDTTLKRLLNEHEREKSNDPKYRDFSDELNKFFSKALTPKLRNLEEKLADGKRDHLIDIAMDSKEKVTKKIEKYCHYKTAQDIYTYILTDIRTAFLHEVQSKIKSGEFQNYEIDDIVKINIIDPLLHNLGESSLRIDKHEIYGLLYFLTGNCYIEWD